MKKIIALFVVMLAFGLNANAQKKAPSNQVVAAQNQESYKVSAEKDLKALKEVVELQEGQEKAFRNLFKHKHEILSIKDLSQERKDVLAQSVESKISSTLTPEQNKKLAAAPGLLKVLSH
ncbi:hypothetical protein GN157_01515 [Flavobacterium rakeshii]|uniref:DUF4890 domain-containing protein n=1 Tax=Flavobacterium rakeshii TaxID=1038845 RepID=A0A6N8H7W4_9FLAO|nr:hypothetical protein [Flavobacterium rakeshii]MEE1899241.1 hypothetical protein [Flavobacterium rakeshii]MUV02372.1 hypothetical protein [Flavobacterium rakeshii]